MKYSCSDFDFAPSPRVFFRWVVWIFVLSYPLCISLQPPSGGCVLCPYDVLVLCFVPAPEYFRVGFVASFFLISMVMRVEEMGRTSGYIPFFE